MSRKKRRQYTPEFKAEAVKLIVDESRTISQTASDLGVAQSVLSRWVSKFRATQQPGALSEIERAELDRLRRDNSILRKERAILKKAAAFFAKEMP